MKHLDKKGIVKRIKELRIECFGERGKCAFAEKLDVNPSTYAFYEKSRIPPIEVLLKICEHTKAELYWLLTGLGPKQGHSQQTSDNFTFVKIPGVKNDIKNMQESEDAWKNYKKINQKLEQFAQNEHFMRSVSAFIDLLAEKEGLEENIPKLAANQPGTPIQTRGKLKTLESKTDESLKESLKAKESLVEERFRIAGSARQSQRPGWIPVLGRTAAGIVYCWKDSLLPEPKKAVTELNDIVQKYIGKNIINAAEGQVAVDVQNPELIEYLQEQQVNLIQLAGTGADEISEFVQSEGIYKVFPDSFALRIDGDSMSPRINDNDVVVLSPSVPAVQGQIAVVHIAEQIGVTCKLIRQSEEKVHLIPLNERYESKIVNSNDLLWALAVLCHIRL